MGIVGKSQEANKYYRETPGHPGKHHLGLLRHWELNRAGRAKYSMAPSKTCPLWTPDSPSPRAEPSPPFSKTQTLQVHHQRCKPNQTNGHLIEKGVRRTLSWQDMAIGRSLAQHPTINTTEKPQEVPESYVAPSSYWSPTCGATVFADFRTRHR